MTGLALDGIDVDAHSPETLAIFWAALLDREAAPGTGSDWCVVPPGLGGEGEGLRLRFVPTSVRKASQNRIHLDLTTASASSMEAMIARALRAGGRRADIGQGDEDPHEVLADPEGNKMCIIEPDNGFLRGTGVIGAVNCDGTRALGEFWSAALGWPLVWDEGEETAIQSPRGGAKITWSGTPLMPRHGRDRIRLALRVGNAAELSTACERLERLGARVASAGGPPAGASSRTMTDPDGNEFVVRVALPH
ncbi:VOC family protein [Brachybacterium halotolerans subsp. kimchii]|uniref:VOC family protein n=1 Tax=Brachybacterium halotolerans TaxID=2795215 RepID=UPI001E34A653|nr:VOC family protein [Brachybacterium halotolerans]UEJ82540.1 VOC family protein [Brachybacterium halotolerans subsp. kimchii]